MAYLLPEIESDGIVLWRIRRAGDRHLWCSFGKPDREFLLVVRDPRTRWTSLAEFHPDRRSLLSRAVELRRQFLDAGWQVVNGVAETRH